MNKYELDLNHEYISLYIHIPFCRRKCRYCDFLSAPAQNGQIDEYINALVAEIEYYRFSDLTNRKVRSVFFGGGTPSILKSTQIERIFSKLKSVFNFEKQAEVTMELNPGTVSQKECEGYRQAGINRISIGLQSACDRELKLLGRIHTYEDFEKTYKWLEDAGFDNINIDIMSALPGQSIETYTDTLNKVLALKPEHISAYSLIIEEGTPFGEIYGQSQEDKEDKEDEDFPPLPDEETERTMYDLTGKLLKEHGYERYEISNYSQKGYECLHNVNYWKRGDYLGLGLGSASLINENRYKNTEVYDDYVNYWLGDGAYFKAGEAYSDEINENEVIENKVNENKVNENEINENEANSDKNTINKRTRAFAIPQITIREELSYEDQIEETMFLGLRMMEGIDLTYFRDTFRQSIWDIYPKVIDNFIIDGYMEVTSDDEKQPGYASQHLRLTEKGIDVSDTLFVSFML